MTINRTKEYVMTVDYTISSEGSDLPDRPKKKKRKVQKSSNKEWLPGDMIIS